MSRNVVTYGIFKPCSGGPLSHLTSSRPFTTTPRHDTFAKQNVNTNSKTTVPRPQGLLSAFPPSSAYALYKTALPPTTEQLSYAKKYFIEANPTFLLGGAKFRVLPESYVPEVVFLGRSNVGKSSLLNALLHRTGTKIANVSSKPGRTREMNAFGIHGAQWIGGEKKEDGTRRPRMWGGRGGLVVLDMPGYGKASRDDWGTEITKYLVGRKHLRRTFVLIDAEHGVKKTDLQLLDVLRFHNITHQIVLSKIDKVLFPSGKATLETLNRNMCKLDEIFGKTKRMITPEERRGVAALDDMLTCSAELDIPHASGNKLGVDNLRWEVLAAAGLACDPLGRVEKLQYDIEQQSDSGSWEPVAV